jgi:hypothetical protein
MNNANEQRKEQHKKQRKESFKATKLLLIKKG